MGHEMKSSTFKLAFACVVTAFALHGTVALAETSHTESELSIPSFDPVLKWLNAKQGKSGQRVYTHMLSEWLPGKQLLWSRFDYETPGTEGNWPNGSWLVLWSPQGGAPIWANEWKSEMGNMHTVKWMDFNGDGLLDLWVLSGEEDEYLTELFLSQKGALNSSQNQTPRFNQRALVKRYESNTSYSSLLDVDGDGLPEILDDGLKAKSEEDSLCVYGEKPLELGNGVFEAASTQYQGLAGRFAQDNPTYAMPAVYEALALKLFAPVRLLKVSKSGKLIAASLPVEHLKWREAVLTDTAAAASADCSAMAKRLLAHNKALLAGSTKRK